MNRIYKVIWSKTKNCYVVASEFAKRCTKSATSKKMVTSVMSLAILFGVTGSVFAQDPVLYDDDYAEQITLEGPVGVGTKVTNVAKGLLSAASTDAVNGSQLYALQQSLNGMNGTISNLSSTVAVTQTDISGIKTNYVTLNSSVNTLKTQVETGFNVTINGAKVKTVNPDSNTLNFSAGNNVSIVNDNGTIKISATGGDGTVGAYYMENGRNTTVATRYDEGNNTIYSVAVNDFGTVASDSEGLVTGKTMHTELRPTADGSYITSANTTAQNLTALDTAVGGAVNSLAVSGQTLTYTKGDGSTGTITLPAGGEGGVTYTAGNGIEISSENAISAKAGTNVTVDANGISVAGNGTVDSGDTGLISGGTLYTEGRVTSNGNYVQANNTIAQNLTALDTKVKSNADAIVTEIFNRSSADTALGNRISGAITGLSVDGTTITYTKENGDTGTITTQDNNTEYTAGNGLELTGTEFKAKAGTNVTVDDNGISVIGNGTVANGDTGLVSGGTVYNALQSLDNKANITLDNISDDGKSVVRTLAQESVKVVDGTNTTVTEGTDGNAKTYAVAVTVDGQIAENNEGLVTGGDIYDYVQDAVSDLDAFAKKDASNVSSDADKWGTALGTGAVAENDGKLVTGGTVYSALKDATDTINTALDSKANIALDNISDDGKTVVRTLAQEAVKVVSGTNTTVTEGTDGNAKTYAVNVAPNGQVAEGNTGIVTGGDVYDYVQGITGGAVAPSDLEAYAKKDASNVTDAGAWGTKIGTGTIASGDTKLVTGDTVYNALQNLPSGSTHFFGVNSTNEYDMNYNGGGSTGTNAIAVGPGAWADSENSIAIGQTSATMFGEKAVAIGYFATALGESATAVGPSSQAPNAFGTAVGSKAVASGWSSTAIGKNAFANGKNSIAIGSDSTATGEDEFSVGRPAIEANAETGQQALPEVKRRITHVDTGTADTDAVNVAQLNSSVGDKATISLDNINEDGKGVVRTLAQEAVKVINGTNTTVTEGTDGVAKTYAVAVNIDGQIAENNEGLVTGGDIYDYVTDATEDMATTSDLEDYAKKDASNVTDATAWGTAVGTGAVAENDGKLVTGGTVYSALKDATDTINTALDSKANTALDNITINGETVIKNLAKSTVNVVGEGKAIVAKSDVNGVDTYTVTVSTDGTVTAGSTGLVDGNTVYEAIQGIDIPTYTADGIVASGDTKAISGNVAYTELRPTDGDYVKQTNTTAENLTALDSALSDVANDMDTKANVDASNLAGYETEWGTAIGTGAVAENDGKLVTGGTVYSAIEVAKTDVQNYTDTVAATKSLNNLNDDGVREIKTIANSAITLENGTNTTVSVRSDGNDGSIYRVNVAGNGIVAENDEGLVTGKTVYEEVRPVADGNYITTSSTTGINLTALDTQVKANADAIEALQNSGGGGVPTNMAAYDDNTKATVTLAGQDGTTIKNVKAGTADTDAVNVSQLNSAKNELAGRITVTEDLLAGDWEGKTVKETLDEKVNNSTFNDYKEETANTISTMNTAIQNKANKDLDNISDAGKSVVRGLAQEAIDVKGEGAITVTSSVENDVKTYTVTVATDGVVEAGNTGIVTGDTVYNAIQDANTATQTALDGKANVSLDNITDDGKTVIRETVKEDLDKKADKDSVYTKDETDTKLSEKADLSYVDDELDKKADKTELDKKADKSYVDEGLNKKADKTELNKKANTDASNIDADKWADKLGTGAVEEGNTGLVNGGAVYEALRDVTGNDIIKADADAGAIRIGNKVKYDSMDSVDISKSDGSTRVLKGIKTDVNDPTSAANVAYVDGMAQGVMDNMKSGFERLDDRISETGAKAAALAGLHPFEIDGDQKWNIAAGVGTYDGKTSGAFGVFYRPTDRVMYNLASTIGDGKAMVSGGISIALDKGVTGMSKRQMAEEIRQIKAENAQLKEAIAYLMQKVEQGAVQNTVQK